MRSLSFALVVALTLTAGCSGGGGGGRAAARAEEPRADVVPAVAIEAPPVVHFRILWKRSWSDFYTAREEDRDLTLEQAEAIGIPAQLWVAFAVADPTKRYSIYLVPLMWANIATEKEGNGT